MSPASLPSNLRVLSALSADHAGFDLSNERYVTALHRAEDEHFWHRARNALITDRLAHLGASPPARVLDLGCGSGCVSAHLARAGYRVTGVDGHLPLLEQAARRAPGATFVLHDLGQGVDELRPEAPDIVGLFDVIEHLDDAAGALAQAASLLRPGGWLVGTVPAMQALWSPVDTQAGHRLRYERAGLAALLAGVRGMEVREVAPFNRLLVPMLWVQRRVVVRPGDTAATSERNLAVPPWPVNQALRRALGVEQTLAPWLDRTPLPGASLWFALQRRADVPA